MAGIELKSHGVRRHPAHWGCPIPVPKLGAFELMCFIPPPSPGTASGSDPQPGGGRDGLITAPETHQRHPAPALCLSSKLPAKGGSAPALHLVSFYGNRKQLLVGDGEAEVKGAGGEGAGGWGVRRNHS